MSEGEAISLFKTRLKDKYSEEAAAASNVKSFEDWLKDDAIPFIMADPYLKSRADYWSANPPDWLSEGDADGDGQSDGWGYWDPSGGDTVTQPTIFDIGGGSGAAATSTAVTAVVTVVKYVINKVWNYLIDNPDEMPSTPVDSEKYQQDYTFGDWNLDPEGYSTKDGGADALLGVAPPYKPKPVSGDCPPQVLNEEFQEKMKAEGCPGTKCKTRSFAKSCRKPKRCARRKATCCKKKKKRRSCN